MEDKIGNTPKNTVRAQSGYEETTGGMWTPWCSGNSELGKNSYINVTLTKGKGDNKVEKEFQIFQSKKPVWYTYGYDYDNKKEIGGDSEKGKREYNLIINDPSTPDGSDFFSYEKRN
ncbi:MAG: hypothetical protein F6K18_16290 [Okeania sp. SIO2C2]|uniref:hypothetical protein n=1 Tax=Okeania sp. SIO2C2 TaxID=2607787 RepID=UPI0013B9EECD|nr:hypothetical protein [Okeania sp. SIO2C2]NEP88263.1 hypothetical protein [Okeania sp. SIO2C2]